jgi:hypothetical protein
MGLAENARTTVRKISALLVFVFSAALGRAAATDICVLVGAPGEPEYNAVFAAAVDAWKAAAERGAARCTIIGVDPEDDVTDRARLERWLGDEKTETAAATWIVYLGHGTFDGREARLSLRGPDVTTKELATWLTPITRPIVFVHGGSASAPFLGALSAPNRIVITATRSGHELNYARFGERFARAVANPAADIDQDGQTSVLEAFVTAAQQVQAFYAENGRLATEHALIDDNGDKQGTPAAWFRGTRLDRRPQGNAEPDGSRASRLALAPTLSERSLTDEQRNQRDRLEHEIETLRGKKKELPEEEYYRQLEAIARDLGNIYRAPNAIGRDAAPPASAEQR